MLWDILKRKMMEYPDARIHEGEASVTYEEAIIFAESFAHGLIAPCYGILCESELCAALAVLSCLAAEKTAVPLSYRYGEAHCRRILEFVRPRYIIGERQGALQVVEIENQRYEEPPESPAFILCTSGTTGEPKGAMLSEGNILSNVRDILRYFQLSAKDKILISRPLYHCAVLTGEFLASLMCGTEIHFLNRSFDMQTYIRLAEKEGITVACATPSFFQMVSRLAGKTMTVSKLAVSGECLTREAASRIRKAFPEAEIYHVYGLTEASPRVAYLAPERFDSMPEMLSHPLASVKMKIVDGAGIEVPDGEEGELIVSGTNVMMGYYNDPYSTADVFTDGWFRTGDLGHLNKDGSLTITGRKKNLIILSNGENVSPEEIEYQLARIPEIKEVVVYTEGNLIVAEIFPEENEMTDADLKAVLQERINDYNAHQPSHKRVNKVKIRKNEFEKTTTHKIKRYKVLEKSKKEQEKES